MGLCEFLRRFSTTVVFLLVGFEVEKVEIGCVIVHRHPKKRHLFSMNGDVMVLFRACLLSTNR
jgi:hypothetical protein